MSTKQPSRPQPEEEGTRGAGGSVENIVAHTLIMMLVESLFQSQTHHATRSW